LQLKTFSLLALREYLPISLSLQVVAGVEVLHSTPGVVQEAIERRQALAVAAALLKRS
jgi:hypothetical protein